MTPPNRFEQPADDQQRLGDIGRDASEPRTDCSSSTSDAVEINPEQVTAHTAETELETWKEERSEAYAYYNLILNEYSDLTTEKQWLEYSYRVHHGQEASSVKSTAGFGTGGLNPDAVVASIVDWYLGKLSTPYHERLRPIPAEHIRVFVSDRTLEYLSDHGINLETHLTTLRSIDEHEAPSEYLDWYEEYRELVEATEYGGHLQSRIRDLEATVRDTFGLSGRGARTEPNPSGDFADLSPNELQDSLTEARAKLDQAEEREGALRSKIAGYEREWRESAMEEHFPALQTDR